MKQTERDLEKALKGKDFLAIVAEFAQRFGVPAKKVRGRHGQVSFADVQLRKLAKASTISEATYLAAMQAEALARGVGLFSRHPAGYKARLEICLAPTTR